MKTATIGEVQKNFARVLKEMKAGEEIIVTNRGKPVARIIPMGARGDIDWPDFFEEAIEIEGKTMSATVLEGREDRM